MGAWWWCVSVAGCRWQREKGEEKKKKKTAPKEWPPGRDRHWHSHASLAVGLPKPAKKCRLLFFENLNSAWKCSFMTKFIIPFELHFKNLSLKKSFASMGWKVSHLHCMYKLTTNIIYCVMRPKIRLCRQDHSLILTRETVNPACKRVQALERAAKSWEDTFRSQTFHPLIILGMEKDLRGVVAFTEVWDYVNIKHICRLSAIFW